MPERREMVPDEILEEIKSEDEEVKSSGSKTARDVLAQYNTDAKKYEILTQEEEVKLGKKVQKGDTIAREHLINSNLRLVMKLANQYAGKNRQMIADLIQEGNIGLIRATEDFNPNRGIRFGTYAAWWIKAYIKRYLKKNSEHRLLSMETPISDDDSLTLEDTLESDTITPEKSAEKIETEVAVYELIASLSDERERVIAKERLLNNKTLNELSQKFGLSRQRVWQIELKLKNKLKNILLNKGITDFE